MRLIVLVAVIITLSSLPAQSQNNIHVETYLIEDFENEVLGELPVSWYNMKGEKKPHTYEEELRKTYNYSVTEEADNKFLRFEGTRAKHLNYPLINKEDLNIYDYPILSWRWRVHDIPEGANEDGGDNDVAASIYVVFNFGRVLFKKVPKSIRYTWSSTLPVGTELSKFYGNQKIVVVASGENDLGKWKSFETNIVEDYKRLFGDKAPKVPLAILILSDGDDTGKYIKADYDDIKLLSHN